VSLTELIRFLVIELTSLNSRFNIDVVFIVNYFFIKRRCSHR
jgi:hypothetical protein